MKQKGLLNIIVVSLLTFFSLSLLFSQTAEADYQSNLAYWGNVKDGSGDLDVTYFSTPLSFDWDNDGLKDLLVGQNYQLSDVGYVSFYKNYGTSTAPVFNGSSRIQACNNSCDLSVTGGG